VQLTGATFPSSLASILLVVDVANKRYEQTFSPSANLVTTFTWDGKDAFGRMVSLLRARRSIILDIVPGAD